MEDPPIPGPSRPRRPDTNLADRIIQLQRKNASTAPILRQHQPTPRVPQISIQVKSPNQQNSPQRTRDQSQSQSSYLPKDDEFSRGAVSKVSRQLFDPARPGHVHTPAASSVPQTPVVDDRSRRNGTGEGSSRREIVPTRKLFDPEVHDPLHFHPRPDGNANGLRVAAGNPMMVSSKVTHVRAVPVVDRYGRHKEEEADKDRERRKRREGSERGSTATKKKEGDSRSKGSRSSEGSESLRDRERGKGKGDTGVKTLLKGIHDKIRELEATLTEMHRKMMADPEGGISVLFDRGQWKPTDDAGALMDLIGKHKELADLHHEFLMRVYDPLIPVSFQQLAIKYNIPSRLWQNAFHLILERLRYAWMTHHPAALDLLTDFVYDAYKFYTDLLEDQVLMALRVAWIEALGDLARYRMAIASHVVEAEEAMPGRSKGKERAKREYDGDEEGEGEVVVPSGASIGAEVAENWDVEDKETWRTTARDWYSMGITEKPGEGRLHHHLALLCRDLGCQEGRALHHFTKSLIVTHEYASSRESILPLFDAALQSQRSLPEAMALDLFVRLHGMLFTKISLDDFPSVMSRYMERLEEDARLSGMNGGSKRTGIGQVDWMMMAAVNIGAVMQFGAVNGLLRKALAQEGLERRKAALGNGDDGGEDGEDGEVELVTGDSIQPTEGEATIPPPSTEAEITPTYTHALELAMSILEFTLTHPYKQQGLHAVLNPYITILLTFISTLLRQPHVSPHLIPSIPWLALVDFLNSSNIEIKDEIRLLAGPPLPEDWLLRGMEWVGRRVFASGFWKIKGSSQSRGSGGIVQPQPRQGERFGSEMDVLLGEFEKDVDVSEGVVDELEGTDMTDGAVAVGLRRWRRVSWAAGILVKHVEGLEVREGKVVIEGVLEEKLEEIERKKREEEIEKEMRRMRVRKVEEVEDVGTESSDDGGDGDVSVLKQHRKHLQPLPGAPTVPRPSRAQRKVKPAVNAVPGYTMLIFDTNVLLSSLSLFSKVVESGQWSVIIPLPVVTELDGLAKNPAPLGPAANSATQYLESHIRSHSQNLKIQTSKGNYLSDLLIRTEHYGSSKTRVNVGSMDDMILGVAEFQRDHFVDRSGMLKVKSQAGEREGGVKVLLITFDRNMRVKARGRGIDAVDEGEMGMILGKE